MKNIEGTLQDYGFRIYDPRLGKFLSVDPLTDKYPYYTPYQFASNMPVMAIDIDGLESSEQVNTVEGKPLENVVITKKYQGKGFLKGVGRFFGGVWSGVKNTTMFAINILNPNLDKNSLVQTGKGIFWLGKGLITDPKGTFNSIKNFVNNVDWSDPAVYGEITFEIAAAVATGGGSAAVKGAKITSKIGKKLGKKADNVAAEMQQEVAETIAKGSDDLPIQNVDAKKAGNTSGDVNNIAGGSITRSLDDLHSLIVATWEEAENLIPKDWVRGPLKKGEGIKFVNPHNKGEQILLEKGQLGAKDPLHGGPYLKISRDGQVIRIPLAGNPTLN